MATSPPPTPPVRRLLSGIRPNGPLHLGHYVGVLRQWLEFQDEFECFFMIADLQALAMQPEAAARIPEFVREVALDWLAAGLDPDRCHFVLQSRLPEISELTVYLQPHVRTGELRKNPTLRREARTLGRWDLERAPDEVALSFLGYPVTQVADILLFAPTPPGAGDRLIVPVGADQLPLIELARDVARRFNDLHGPVFVEPEARTSSIHRLPGVDGGSKMGKSLRNAILLKEPSASLAEKVKTMCTDPLRLRREDPGHPDACPCFVFRRAFGEDPDELEERRRACLEAGTDCEDCKDDLAGELERFLAPIRARRAAHAGRPDELRAILSRGTARAREVARETIAAVRCALRLDDADLCAPPAEES